MNRIIDRYLLKHIITATLRGFGWFAGLLVAITVITAVRRVVNDGLPLSTLVIAVGFELPRIAMYTLPMSALFGTVQTFTELSDHGEMAALFAGGASLIRLLRAPILWGMVMMALTAGLQEVAVPYCQRAEDASTAQRLLKTNEVKEGLRYINPPDGPVESILQAKSFVPGKGLLIEPRLQIFDDNGRVRTEITARRAEWNSKRGQWTLYHGELVQRPEDRSNGASIISRFEQMTCDAPAPGILQRSTKTLQQHLEHNDFEFVSLVDLWRYRQLVWDHLQSADTPTRVKYLTKALVSSTFGIHDKIATPFLCLAVVLVGMPLGLRAHRARGNFAMGVSLAVLLGYYIFWTWAITMGTSGTVNPVFMAYVSLSLVTMVGIGLVWYKSRLH